MVKKSLSFYAVPKKIFKMTNGILRVIHDFQIKKEKKEIGHSPNKEKDIDDGRSDPTEPDRGI
ncbi:MAG: hypothetical protein R2874_16010 [Desulfobacterales bacterium]